MYKLLLSAIAGLLAVVTPVSAQPPPKKDTRTWGKAGFTPGFHVPLDWTPGHIQDLSVNEQRLVQFYVTNQVFTLTDKTFQNANQQEYVFNWIKPYNTAQVRGNLGVASYIVNGNYTNDPLDSFTTYTGTDKLSSDYITQLALTAIGASNIKGAIMLPAPPGTPPSPNNYRAVFFYNVFTINGATNVPTDSVAAPANPLFDPSSFIKLS